MKYGRIRIEGGNLMFTKHMMTNSLPCRDILWAYMRREGIEGGIQKQLMANYLVIVTKRRKRYKFDMTEKEVEDCIQLLKALNPDIATGFPKGGRIPLHSLSNTRDLGALTTEDGRHILPRKLLRSGALYHVSLSDQDTLLNEYRLSEVVDFRTPAERAEKPDTLMQGVKYHDIPVFEEEMLGISRNKRLKDAISNFRGQPQAVMKRHYEALIRDQYSIKQYARFLDVVLHHNEGAILWHCSAGKDRAGVGTALLLCVLGVPREVIRDDYMKTNLYLESELEYMIRFLESKMIVDEEVMERIRILFRVKEEYLDTVFRTIEQDYGSVERFLRKALYLTPKAVSDLRNKYLV